MFFSLNPQISELNFLLGEIESIIHVDDIKVIYPKNLFRADKHVEIYILNQNYLIQAVLEAKKVVTNVFRLQDIAQFISVFDSQSQARTLILKFVDSETIELNSMQDTDGINTQRFSRLVLEMFKVLTAVKQ